MRIVILYHPNSEQDGMTQDFKRDFEARHYGQTIELVSLETKEGSDMAALYDIVRYPALLVLTGDGGLQKLWQDLPWPSLDEVYSYARP
ncbi:MAG TPA: hypothetical protein VFT49_02425 [Candidatus Saccharimonadales bacterium]|nr:hypothetical protein [Candidatus Saccharimonadales bacterium]